jgi:hypothetical protein
MHSESLVWILRDKLVFPTCDCAILFHIAYDSDLAGISRQIDQTFNGLYCMGYRLGMGYQTGGFETDLN